MSLTRCSLLLLPLVAACSSEAETIIGGPADPQAAQLAAAAPVTLPPAIAASRTYRCDDNSLLYADFYTNDTVSIRLDDKRATPTMLAAAGANAPFVSDGYSLSANAESISFTAPGKAKQNCDA